jgi:hypothetical protein
MIHAKLGQQPKKTRSSVYGGEIQNVLWPITVREPN